MLPASAKRLAAIVISRGLQFRQPLFWLGIVGIDRRDHAVEHLVASLQKHEFELPPVTAAAMQTHLLPRSEFDIRDNIEDTFDNFRYRDAIPVPVCNKQ